MPKRESKYPEKVTVKMSKEQRQLVEKLAKENHYGSMSDAMRELAFGNGNATHDPELEEKMEKTKNRKAYYKENAKILAKLFYDVARDETVMRALQQFLVQRDKNGDIIYEEDGETPKADPNYFKIQQLADKLKIREMS